MFITGNLIFDLIAILATLLSGVILCFKYWFSYWKRRGLEYIEPSIPFGNTRPLFKQECSLGEQFSDFYKHFKAKGLKHGGVYFFGRAFYIPVDAEIIKNMMIKDFQYFVDRGFYVNEKVDPLTARLFTMEGTKWKNLRAKLTATFTSGKMKMMFDTMADTAKELDHIMEEAFNSKQPIDVKDILARFTTDVISSCAFGLEATSLKNPKSEFRHFGRRIFEHTPWENIQNLLQLIVPVNLLKMVNFTTSKPDVEHFFLNVVKKTVEYREKNNIYRKDFLHLLLQLKNRGKLSDDEKITDQDGESNNLMTIEELAAQVFVFFLAGFETSSTATTFAMYELSKNQSIQNKVREEINDVLVKFNNTVSYDAIMAMPYLDKVVNETLRKYPSLPILNRKCTQTYHVPGTDLVLEEGTMCVISNLAIQHDPEYYPNPEKFDPERFSEENKKSRPQIAYLPFGDGPRNCIGARFGLIQTKLGLITLLRNYKTNVSQKTIEPIGVDTTNITYGTKNVIYLDITKP